MLNLKKKLWNNDVLLNLKKTCEDIGVSPHEKKKSF